MTDAFHLKIISPASSVLDAHVSSVEIPGAEGDFGVLPGHSSFFSMLRPGVVRVALADGTRRRFFAATGYADVTDATCTILSDHIEDMSEITTAEAQEALSSARAALANASTEPQKRAAETLLATAEALVSALAA